MQRVVVITGASAGIGAATARELARRGELVVLAARRTEALRALAHDLGDAAHVVTADVTERRDVERIRDEAIREFGCIDAWINNAGRGIVRPTLDLTDEDIDAMISVNVKSALYGMQVIAPHFLQRGKGHIVNISSFLTRVPAASLRSAYSASKAALNILTANARMDLQRASRDIHVTLVMPGLVTTEFAAHALWSTGAMPPGPAGTPMTPQTPEQVATVVADVLGNPVAEVYTNPASVALAARYYEDVAAFEAGQRR
jgi:short-subunit dehydrogenase